MWTGLLNNNHWTLEGFRQRMTMKDWKKVLLEKEDSIVFRGELRQLKACHLGAGVVEVYKKPL